MVPLDEDVMDIQCSDPFPTTFSVQSTPELSDVQIFPPLTTAASLSPLDEDVMENHPIPVKAPVQDPVCSAQIAPESIDVQIFPYKDIAASLSPLDEDVMDIHHEEEYPVSVQFAPESVEVEMFPPPLATAASLFPSDEDVMDVHAFEDCTLVSFVHTKGASVYPLAHVQVNDPSVSTQSALASQVSVPCAHSSRSDPDVKIYPCPAPETPSMS